jgi:RND family efflux transporter MFP subunit
MRMIIVGMGGLMLVSLAACSRPAPPESNAVRPVRAMRVADEAAFVDRWYPGTARATEEVNIAFEVSGRIIEYPVNVGDRVEAGQLLARLDPSDYQNDLNAALAQRDQSQAYLERITQAAETGAVAQQEVTDAQAQFDVANSTVQIRQKALADTRITAPFAGTISTNFAENFQNVQAKEAVVRLLDISKIEMTVDVPEGIISLVPYATEIRCRFTAFPGREVPARVQEIGAEPSQTTRTYPITLIMDQPDDFTILPGMSGEVTGRAEVPAAAAETGFEVPMSAIFQRPDGETFVWVIDEAAANVSLQAVEMGEMTPRGVLVKGIDPGQMIATAGVHFLEEGQTVRILGGEEAMQ